MVGEGPKGFGNFISDFNANFVICVHMLYNIKKMFYEKFSIIKRYIQESEIEKAIISNIISYSYKGSFLLDKFLLKLKDLYPKCTIFLYDYPDKGKYLGASPEKVLDVNNNNLKIDALAGSVNRTNNKSDDISNAKFILKNKKINEEHDIVVKGIVDNLNTPSLTIIA